MNQKNTQDHFIFTISVLCLIFLFWTSSAALAVTYYVSTNGNDSNPGSQDRPWRTIGYASSVMQAGDTTIVTAGTYNENVSTTRNGSSGNRITFRAQGTVRTHTFQLYNDYVTIDGFEMTNANQLFMMNIEGDYCEILNNTIHDVGSAATIQIILRFRPVSSYGVVRGNRFYQSTGTNGQDLVVMEFHGSNHLAEDNEIGPMVDIDAFRPAGDYITIKNNYIHDITNSGSGAHTDIFQVFGQTGDTPHYNVIENNLIVDFSGQLCMTEMGGNSDMGDFDIRNNVFVRVDGQANLGIPNMRWYNNTFYDVGSGNRSVFSATAGLPKGRPDGLQIFNNLIIPSSNITRYEGEVLSIARDNGLTGFAYGNNYVTRIDNFGPLTDFTETNGINGGDPQFVDAAGLDFRLQVSSNAIDTGAILTGFNYDHAAQIRPQGNAWDIGAFEYTSGVSSLLPSAPTNPSVQ